MAGGRRCGSVSRPRDLVLTVIGHAIVVWAMGANAFFSADCAHPGGKGTQCGYGRTLPLDQASGLCGCNPVFIGNTLPFIILVGIDPKCGISDLVRSPHKLGR